MLPRAAALSIRAGATSLETTVSRLAPRSLARALHWPCTNFLGGADLVVPPRSLFSNPTRGIATKVEHESSLLVSIGGKKDKAYVVKADVEFDDGSKDTTELLMTPSESGSRSEVLTTTCYKLVDQVRKERGLLQETEQELSTVLRSGDRQLGSIQISIHGTYAAGAPTSRFGEQIGPDSALFMLSKKIEKAVSYWESILTSITEGPRVGSMCKIAHICSKSGEQRSVLLKSQASVNTTKHLGIEMDSNGKTQPLIQLTPGDKLRARTKTKIVETDDGASLQTVSTFINASANVLAGWVGRASPESLTGMCKVTTPEGWFKEKSHEGFLGRTFLKLCDAFTGTPFAMTTITARRDLEGKVSHVMIHSRHKPWPASEMCVKFEDKDGEVEFSLYSTTLPDAGTWGDDTVAKLATPVMLESTRAYAIVDEKLVEIDPSSELYKVMHHENISMRFNFRELNEFGACLGMRMSAFGISVDDTRASLVAMSKNGEFSVKQREKMVQDLIAKDPGTVEHMFCAHATKILAECIERTHLERPELWTTHGHLKELWEFAISQTPNYETMKQGIKKYGALLDEIVTPDEKARLLESRQWAKAASKERIRQLEERMQFEDPPFYGKDYA